MKLRILQLNPKKCRGQYSCKYLGFLAVNEDEVLNSIPNYYMVYCDIVENRRSCANRDLVQILRCDFRAQYTKSRFL